MSLIATARAVDDARFIWRVNAALLRAASIRKDSELAEEVMYAEYILRNPMVTVPALVSLAAVDPAVGEAVTVDAQNTVNTEGVKDETLMYVAEFNFARLAKDHVEGASVLGAGSASR